MKKTALELSDLEEVMNQHWHQIKKDDEDNAEEKGKELTLSAFNGKCFNCGEMGHRANKCPQGKKKFAGTCHNCGEQGHKSSDCWEKEENKSKRPSYFKPKKEQSAAAVESSRSRMEALLCGLSAPESQEILSDPNIWIGDSGASVHMTPFVEGFKNLREATSSDSIAMGDKSVEKTSKSGDLSGILCDKHGNELQKTMMQDVALVPASGCNLFSIAKSMKSRWTLSGSKDIGIQLKKDGHCITFDVCIPTPKGIICAMHLK